MSGAALVWEDSTYRGATKPVHHNYGRLRTYSPCSATREATTVRSSHTAAKKSRPPSLTTTRESLCTSTKHQHSANKEINIFKKINCRCFQMVILLETRGASKLAIIQCYCNWLVFSFILLNSGQSVELQLAGQKSMTTHMLSSSRPRLYLLFPHMPCPSHSL